MDREFSDFISTVLDKTDIVKLISRYVPLERKGNTFWGCCPFHHETQPSFAVNEGKQFFHCFGCKESGNAISFVKKIENVEFYDALKMLAEQAGLEIPKSSGNYEKTDKKKRETLYTLMRDAARHYHDNLKNPAAKPYIDYLESRKIPPNMVTKFGLGASLDFTEMISFLKSKGYTYEQIHDAGIAETKDGRQYDVFGKRLMFPIIDNMGRVVAFGGRTLEKDPKFAKYRNSSQTDIFDKSKVIYGVNLLKKRKSVRKIDYCIMTEGYMDVIALHRAGFDTTVASMGTALTVKQARQLKLYSDLVYISYDGDTAGQKATLRGLDILRECGLIVKVVRLPDGLDPDDVIKRDGSDGYKKLLREAIPLTEYKIEVLKNRYNLADPDEKALFAIEAAKVVSALDNPVEQEQYLTVISKHTGFSVDALKRQSDLNIAESAKQEDARPRDEQTVKLDSNLRFFLWAIVSNEPYVDFDYDIESVLPNDSAKKLYAFCKSNGGADARIFDNDVFSDEDKAFINELLDYNPLPGDGEKKYKQIGNAVYLKALTKKRNELTSLYRTSKNKSYLQQALQLAPEIEKLRHKEFV